MKANKEDHVIHFPDLLFITFCENQYGINKGIYNTIESWFYDKGYVDILERRKTIIHFLELSRKEALKSGKLRFGHGGLVPKLNEFMMNQKYLSLTS
ncbi:hypothetical protein [Ammoniphilus sp. 3BR4]|uniref:hypothetical protein n=1 Tax=Ammoniphilus sp. 3BR4 TaxID=3158265 RepID=UPI003465053B